MYAAEPEPLSSGTIELRGVTKRFTTNGGATYTALRDLDLDVAPGEFCAVVGPTGCGKSTTLTLVSGLERPSLGSVKVNGEQVAGIAPGVGFMFQTDAILPWKTVLGNVTLGPVFRAYRKRKRSPGRATGCAGSAWSASRSITRTSSRGECASG